MAEAPVEAARVVDEIHSVTLERAASFSRCVDNPTPLARLGSSWRAAEEDCAPQ